MSKKHFIELADMVRRLRKRYQEADSTALISTSGGCMLDLVEKELGRFLPGAKPRFQAGPLV